MKTILMVIAAAAGTAARASHAGPAPKDQVYEAQLNPMNTTATNGKTGGLVRFTIHGNRITIETHLHDVPPGIEHWQHFHGKVDGAQSTCPIMADDANHDGFIDISETEPAAGTTMVPFNADPVAMEIPTHTYPHANGSGAYNYTRTVSLDSLQSAFGGVYHGKTIDLDHRVAMVHGVPESTRLPASVVSLGTIPSRVTLPIACGAIKRIR